MAAIQDIKDGKVETAAIVKALQTVLLFLGNASQHHAVQCHQSVLQQLNLQLKSLIKDEDFADAPPYLFGECFASLAKERLEASLVLKKFHSTSSTAKQVFREATPKNMLGAVGVATDTEMARKAQGAREDNQQEQATLPDRVLLQQRNDWNNTLHHIIHMC